MRRNSPGKQRTSQAKGSPKRSKESLKQSKERIKPARNSGPRPPRQINRLLSKQTFLSTIRRSTELALNLNWGPLQPDQEHAKVLELSQLVINDLFGMITSSFADARVGDTVEDFVKTFYPVVMGIEEGSELGRVEDRIATEGQVSAGGHDGYKSFDTFGGEKAAVMLTQSMMTFNNDEAKNARNRTPGRPGYGIFEHAGTDLALIKDNAFGRGAGGEQMPGSVNEIRDLCTKIYRSTNMRYQQIAKLIMRNRGEEIRRMVQMKFCHQMPQHVSLTITKLNV